MTWLTAALTRFLLALIVLGLFAGAVVIMSFVVMPEQNRDVIIQLIGGINTLAGLVIGYYFGSSAKRDDAPAQVEVTNPPERPVLVDNPEGGA